MSIFPAPVWYNDCIMKFLLTAVNAKFIHSNPAVYSLKAYAGLFSHADIEIAEYTINETPDEILSGIYERHPDFIGFSCYIWNRETVFRIIPELKKILPDVIIWLGGPEVSYCAEEILSAYPEVTGITTGEGEHSFSELVQAYEKDTVDLQNIHGIVFRKSGNTKPGSRASFISTPPLILDDLSAIPFLYQDTDPQRFENRILYYESSRGCPFSCSYCLSSIDRRLRFRRMDIVKKELQYFLDHRVRQVKFVDRTFNANESHAIAIWQYLKDHDNGVTNFHFELEAELITEKELELLSSLRPGLIRTEIGVQSTNQKALSFVNRRSDFSRLSSVVTRILRAGNIPVHLDLIAGLPFEDYQSFSRSFDDVYSLHPDELQLGFLKILKGTQIEKDTESCGISYRSFPPYEVLSTRWLSYEDVLRLKKIEAVLEIYHNSGQFRNSLPLLEKQFERPFLLYENLAAFYEKKNAAAESFSQQKRFDLLLDFFEAFGEKNQLSLFREQLTSDFNLNKRKRYRHTF